jgi:hypothetical protein
MRAGFRKFLSIFSMHRARVARVRGFDSLPSLSDVGTFTSLYSICASKSIKTAVFIES